MHGQISVSTSAGGTTIAEKHQAGWVWTRIHVKNLDATNPVYLKWVTRPDGKSVTASNGYRLAAGEEKVISKLEIPDEFQTDVTAIATGGSVSVAYVLS